VLSAEDQAHIAAFVVNKFRGDLDVLRPGLVELTARTGRPVLGVLPWQSGLWLDVEDSLDLHSRPPTALPPVGDETLRVAVVRLPRLSNVTDIDALSCEPGVVVRLVTSAADIDDADLVVLPGTRATVSDLDWLHRTGIADAVVRRAQAGGQTIGICGGFQMLARDIDDAVESRRGTVAGLGLLPAHITFATTKTLARPRGTACGETVDGYEIHHGVVRLDETALDAAGGEPFLDGCAVGSVWGTSWHGIFENDAFRRAFLTRVAAAAGRRFVPAPDTSFAALRAERLDALGDLVEQHLDTAALTRLIENGVPHGLPTVVSHLS
jgi:adenosylcobyric acid synthase